MMKMKADDEENYKDENQWRLYVPEGSGVLRMCRCVRCCKESSCHWQGCPETKLFEGQDQFWVRIYTQITNIGA